MALTPEQSKVAFDHLAQRSYINKFPRIQQKREDDKKPKNQEIGLFTFIPSQDAKPDKNGLYGLLRLRGNFPNSDKADDHARYLITSVSSYDEILYAPIGKDVPLVTDMEKYCSDMKEIDVQKQMEQLTIQDLRGKIEKEKKETEDIMDKKKKMEEMNKLIEQNTTIEEMKIDMERYTELRVKHANQKMRKTDLLLKLAECAKALGKSRREILIANGKTNCEFAPKFLEHYTNALKKINTPKLEMHPVILQLKRDQQEDKELDTKMILLENKSTSTNESTEVAKQSTEISNHSTKT